MLCGRFLLIVPVLAIAGSLARKQPVPATAGTFPTGTPLFAGLLARRRPDRRRPHLLPRRSPSGRSWSSWDCERAARASARSADPRAGGARQLSASSTHGGWRATRSCSWSSSGSVARHRRIGDRRPEANVFAGLVAAWLWFTVLFANFAEAMAEGRGKAQAEALRQDACRDDRAHAGSPDGDARGRRPSSASPSATWSSSRPAR